MDLTARATPLPENDRLIYPLNLHLGIKSGFSSAIGISNVDE